MRREGPASGGPYFDNSSNEKAVSNSAAFSPTWEGRDSKGFQSRVSNALSVLSRLSKRADSKLSDGTNSPDDRDNWIPHKQANCDS